MLTYIGQTEEKKRWVAAVIRPYQRKGEKMKYIGGYHPAEPWTEVKNVSLASALHELFQRLAESVGRTPASTENICYDDAADCSVM